MAFTRVQASVFCAGALLFATAETAVAQSWGSFKAAAISSAEEGKLDLAEKHWLSALELCDGTNQRDPRFCTCIKGLAAVYRKDGKDTDAEALYKRVVPDINSFCLGGRELNECAADYASLLKQLKREQEAETLLSKLAPAATAIAPESVATSSKEIATSSLIPPRKPTTPTALQSEDEAKWSTFTAAAKSQLGRKNYGAAELSFRNALRHLNSAAEADPRISQTYKSLTEVFELQGKIAEADLAHHGTLQWIQKNRGPMNNEYVAALMKHGMLLRKLNRKAEALREEGKAEKVEYVISGKSQEGTNAFQSITSLAVGTGSIIGGMNFATTGGTSAGGGMSNAGTGGGFYTMGGFAGGGG